MLLPLKRRNSSMTPDDYREILAALDDALKACSPAGNTADESERKIWDDLQEARTHVLRMLAGSSKEDFNPR